MRHWALFLMKSLWTMTTGTLVRLTKIKTIWMANLSLYIEQILRSVIPEELEIPSSFTQIGHIAHLNLKEQYFPWKKIIGQVILDVSHLVLCIFFYLYKLEFLLEKQVCQNCCKQDRSNRYYISFFQNGNIGR